MSRLVVYDIETLSNCFTYTAIDKDSKEIFQYVIFNDRNDIIELYKHLKECTVMIGYNNINFDYPIIHYLLTNEESFLKKKASTISKLIYEKAQKVISQEYSSVKEEEVLIFQLDLFRIWHYDNKAKLTSLKKLEISMSFNNVMDMPYSHETEIQNNEQVKEILDYNYNDVEATLKFYELTKDKIELRKGLMTKYNLPCLNYPDSKIGEQLMLKLYCEFTNQKEELIKKKRTNRKLFKFSECIPHYINFSTPEFNQLLDYLKNIEVTELKESFKYSFEYNEFTFDLGTGGIHGCIKPGIYESDENNIVLDVDVASLYPSLAITLNLYPEHLGEEFSQIYEKGIVKPRLEAKKKGDKVMADGFKLSANSVFGKSNSEYSFLYDPLYTLKTTLAGQLALCMLSEMVMTRVPNIKVLQINTDGLTVIIPNEHKRLYWEICQEWESKTKLILEYVAYSKMIIRDVNNYIAITKKDNKIKYKGAFKPNNEMIKDGEYHKSFSQGIVAAAISDFFIKGIPVENTVKNNKDIYLFCKTFNATHGWTCDTSDVEHKDIKYEEAVQKLIENGWTEFYKEGFFIPPNSTNISGVQLLKEGNKIKVYKNIQKQQKTNRYFISKNGKTFRKLKDDRIIEIEAGNTLVTIFNKYYQVNFEEYNVDYEYYIQECYKIIHLIDGTTEKLEQKRKEEGERIKKQREEDNFIKFCIDKIPTTRQRDMYSKEWLIEKYGYIKSKEELKNEGL